MPTLFDPTPAQTDDLIQAVASDRDASLRDLAERFSTTLEQLTLWLAKPDIESRLAALESAAARRTRLLAVNNLPAALDTLSCILADHREHFNRIPADRADPRFLQIHRRAAETARRAATLLLRFANFTHGPRPPRQPSPPAPSPSSSPPASPPSSSSSSSSSSPPSSRSPSPPSSALPVPSSFPPMPSSPSSSPEGATGCSHGWSDAAGVAQPVEAVLQILKAPEGRRTPLTPPAPSPNPAPCAPPLSPPARAVTPDRRDSPSSPSPASFASARPSPHPLPPVSLPRCLAVSLAPRPPPPTLPP